MKRILILISVFAILLTSCCQEHSHNRKRKRTESYWPVNVCGIADPTGQSCYLFKAAKVRFSSQYTSIIDLDGDEYQYNNAGWSIQINPRVE